ncbi:hypothetical protein DMH01_02760 [Amycolatopsis sp. WAC 04182]|uniref:hypothetical protein n=1 Tax=Amycolatopsis sp. WAC 04182 TaxID=2203198 RepID=UPI000F76AFFE|nr:hypothetical protein [Amycolatopsis sp. WAC 04182]RSN65328.1 hypothetical protein DMH01_02760 [Amycolatopsis sp. WAC 04182]
MLRPVLDPSPAEWISPRLGGAFGAAGRTVPRGYAAYARLCHPAERDRGGWASWGEAAAETGRRAHGAMQWHALVGSPDPVNLTGSLWRGSPPGRGTLPSHSLTALLAVLGDHTSASDAWFGLWDGYGWADEATLSREHLDAPRLRHPGRDYLLFRGPLTSATELGWRPRPNWFEAQSPNLFWPDDRAWCVATEVDFDSTLVAGEEALVDALVKAPGLEVWRIESDTSLAADGDRINQLP